MNTRITPHDLARLATPPFIVFAFNTLAYTIAPYSYDTLYLDTPMHFLGGVSIAISSAYFLKLCEKNKLLSLKSFLLRTFIIVSFVALAATLWEFYEFLSDRYLGTLAQATVFDTMKDYFMGLAGGLIYCLVRLKK